MTQSRKSGRIGVDRAPQPSSAAGAADRELAQFLNDWADKCEREQSYPSSPGYQWGIDGLRAAAARLELVDGITSPCKICGGDRLREECEC